jgi:putative endonuclease
VGADVVRLHHQQHQFSRTGIYRRNKDLRRRLPEQNAGKSTHTAKFKPWKSIWYCAFPDKYRALDFEKYLKSHSGRAFAKKHL